ncbi:MAG: lamin tail domain-containing protein [Nannocystaceae bacterium]
MRPRILPRSSALVALLVACSHAASPGEGDDLGLSDGSGGPGAAACGDGSLDPGEVCDGEALDGRSCHDLQPLYTGGALACASDCRSYDVSACDLPPGTALVTLNEIRSAGAQTGEWAGRGDLIELYNAGDAPADLSGWRLADDLALPEAKTYVFPAGAVLSPGAWRVLVERDDTSGAGDFPFGVSQDKEETIVLVDGPGAVVDSVTFDGADARGSWCRVPDGGGGWDRCEPTFGAANVADTGTCGDGEAGGIEACDGDDLGGATCAALGFVGGALGCTATCLLDTSACESGSAVVINELESSDDDIELYNAGDAPIELGGWILTDDPVSGPATIRRATPRS